MRATLAVLALFAPGAVLAHAGGAHVHPDVLAFLILFALFVAARK